MRLYKCDKTVLRFHPNAAPFLNGYTTNTVDAPRTVFADLQGRVVAVAHQHKVSEDEVHVIVERRFVERLLSHLKKYLTLSDTAVDVLDKKVYWNLETHELVVTDDNLPTFVSEKEFTLYRVQNGAPLQGVDFDQELVLNLADDSLVSYTKGCYLGQEVVARVHYRGKPPKRLSVKSEKECGAEELARMTSRVFDPVRGAFSGFIFDKNEGGV